MARLQLCYMVEVYVGPRPDSEPLGSMASDENIQAEPILVFQDPDSRLQLTLEITTSLSSRLYGPLTSGPLCIMSESGEEQSSDNPDEPFQDTLLGQINASFFLTELLLDPPAEEDAGSPVAASSSPHHITLMTELVHTHLDADLDTICERERPRFTADAIRLVHESGVRLHPGQEEGDFLYHVKYELMRLFARSTGMRRNAGDPRLGLIYGFMNDVNETEYIHAVCDGLLELQVLCWAYQRYNSQHDILHWRRHRQTSQRHDS